MALIECSECGKQISEMASSCPNCGITINQESDKQDFSLETKDGISSILNIILIIWIVLQFFQLLLEFENTKVISTALTIGFLSLTFYQVKKYKSRLFSVTMFIIYTLPFISIITNNTHYIINYSYIMNITSLFTMGYILYLTILYHQKSEE